MVTAFEYFHVRGTTPELTDPGIMETRPRNFSNVVWTSPSGWGVEVPPSLQGETLYFEVHRTDGRRRWVSDPYTGDWRLRRGTSVIFIKGCPVTRTC